MNQYELLLYKKKCLLETTGTLMKQHIELNREIEAYEKAHGLPSSLPKESST